MINRSQETAQQYMYSERLNRQISNFFHYTFDVTSAAFFFNDGEMYTFKQHMDFDETVHRQAWYTEALTDRLKVKFYGLQQTKAQFHRDGDYVSAAVSPAGQSLLSDVEMILFLFQGSTIQKLLESRVKEINVHDSSNDFRGNYLNSVH